MFPYTTDKTIPGYSAVQYEYTGSVIKQSFLQCPLSLELISCLLVPIHVLLTSSWIERLNSTYNGNPTVSSFRNTNSYEGTGKKPAMQILTMLIRSTLCPS